MKREEQLTLDEFVTAPRKIGLSQMTSVPLARQAIDDAPQTEAVLASSERKEDDEIQETRTEARKALRRLKRERMKGVQNFVNVHLDRETKKRLKLASFTSELPMQSLMETAIRKFLDENGF
jgi:ElaB/YqjD/DUF883 family membrane-anchored ribosome-binding protein